jgi:hypothetical protein
LTLAVDDLTESAIWRDLLALTGTFRTFYGAANVTKAWRSTFGVQSSVDLRLVPQSARVTNVLDASSWVDAQFTFSASEGGPQLSCSGFISLVPDGHGRWKIWMLRTILDGIADYGNVDVLDPVKSQELVNGYYVNGKRRTGEHRNDSKRHFDVIVVGGGQAGLGVGGRLQALNVSYVIVDKFEKVGDSWNTRYDSTKRESIPTVFESELTIV